MSWSTSADPTLIFTKGKPSEAASAASVASEAGVPPLTCQMVGTEGRRRPP